MKRRLHAPWLRCPVIVAGVAAAAGLAAAVTAATPSLDGITVIDFRGGQNVLPGGDHIVLFVSSRGSYATVESDLVGSSRGCLAGPIPGSYTGRSIELGEPGDVQARRFRQETLCPRFSLTLEGDDTVRVRAGSRYSRRHRIIAHVPFVAVDFGAAPFASHALKGVRLGPVSNPDELGPFRMSLDAHSYVYRYFRHEVGIEAGKRRSVQGYAAPAHITGWPWDVLYSARYQREYERAVDPDGLRQALFREYGTPSSESADGMEWFWIYDLEGHPISLGDASGPCSDTLGYWLKQDSNGRATSLGVPANKQDVGAWGCSLLMDINARTSTGGVSHYSVQMVSGYVMAMNHFFQRIAEPAAVKAQLEALQQRKVDLGR